MGRVKEFYLQDQSADWAFTGWEEETTLIYTSCQLGNHKFPNTGLLKSWCKECGIEAEFDRDKGQYVCTGRLPPESTPDT